jgi:hypothetical protein
MLSGRILYSRYLPKEEIEQYEIPIPENQKGKFHTVGHNPPVNFLTKSRVYILYILKKYKIRKFICLKLPLVLLHSHSK